MNAKSVACAVAIVAVLVGFFGISPGVNAQPSPAATAGALAAPYPSADANLTDAATHPNATCAVVKDIAGPSANRTTGATAVDVGVQSVGCGAISVSALAGFWTQTFEPAKNGTYRLTVTWDVSYSALVGVAAGAKGTGHATGYAELSVYLVDTSHLSKPMRFVVHKVQADVLYNSKEIRTGSWTVSQPKTMTVVFDVVHGLHMGQVYTLYSGLVVYAKAYATKLFGACSGSSVEATLVGVSWALT